MTRLTSQLVKEVVGDIGKEERRHIEMAVVKLLLKLVNYQQFSKLVSPYMNTAGKKNLRNAALNKFEVIVSLKNALIEILRDGINDKFERKLVFKRWKLDDHSSLIEGLKTERCYTAAVKSAKSCSIRFENPEDVRRKCGLMVMSIESQIASFVNYKLAFIVKSNNLTPSVLISELQEKCVLTYYSESPYKPETHLINTLKRSFRNKGLHLIKYYSAGKRCRLTNDGQHNFQNTCISLDYKKTTRDDGGENYGIYDQVSSDPEGFAVADFSRFDIADVSMSWNALVAQHGHKPTKHKILRLLSLQPDELFIKFVKQKYPRRIRATNDVEDIYEKLGRKEYLKTVREFTGAKKKPFYEFVHYIQDSVGG